MSKPLTIKELKALKADEWVWIEDFNWETYPSCHGAYEGKMYARIHTSCDADKFLCGTVGLGYYFNYSDYGKTWLAYKNKEEAESKYDSLAVENEVLKRDKENLERTLEEISTALYGANIIIDSDGNIHDKRVEEAKKQTAKEILQELYHLPVCTHPTIGTGQYTFGRRFVKDWAKSKYGVEVDE